MTQEFFERPFYGWSGYAVLLLGFIITLIYQLVYYRRLLSVKKQGDAREEQRPISVLLNVRNESARLEGFLMKLLSQNYADFEIVVVDDFSADSTLIVLGVMARKYPKIKFSSLNQENRYSEKMSMNLALKAAKHDWVLFLTPETNLDDPDYLAKLNARLNDDSSALVAYVNYAAGPGRHNRWSRIERMNAFWRASACRAASNSVFFQQINVLFNKQLYFESGGFKGKMNAHYAGLELVFNQLATCKVKYTIDKQTQLREERLVDESEYDELMRKHVRLFAKLPARKKMFARFENLAKALVIGGVAALLVTDWRYWFLFVPVPVILLLIHLILLRIVQKNLSERKIFLSSLVYVIVRPFLYLFFRTTTFLQAQRSKWN